MLAHSLQHFQILHHQLSCGADTDCLRGLHVRVYSAEHGQHKASRLSTTIVSLQEQLKGLMMLSFNVSRAKLRMRVGNSQL